MRLMAICLATLVLNVLAPPARADKLPDWMEHWEFSWSIDEDTGPAFSLDPIVPLVRGQDDSQVVFVEPRVTLRNKELLSNLGVGYRQLTPDRAWLLGTNMFWDYDTTHSHYRLGWGLEAMSTYAEARTNFYLPLSQERLVEERGGVLIFEDPVNGFDFELGAPVPYYSRLKLFGGYNWYNYQKFKNRYGWTVRTEYTPVPFVVIDGRVSDDTKGNVDWGLTLAFRLPIGGNIKPAAQITPFALDAQAFPDSDASIHLFRLVERHHEIVVERREEKSGVSVEIARGT